jgi:AhpD family alkylhydroperoxidase
MTWLPRQAEGATALDRVLGLRPNLAAEHRAFDELLRSGRFVDAGLLDLCRRHVARLHGVAGAGGAGGAEASACSELERAALGLAGKFALEPHAASDADVAAVASRLSPPELIALVQGLALADGFVRVGIVLGVATDEPGTEPRRSTRAPADRVPSGSPRLQPPRSPGSDAISGSVLAHQPELLQAFLRLYGTLWSHGVVDHPTKEVLRIRNARVTGCNYCKSIRFAEARRQGLQEEHVAQVDDGWLESSLPDRHKTALRLADAFLLDPHGLTAEGRSALLAEFSPAEIVEMTVGLALFMGFSKITVILGREPVSMPTTIVPTPEIPT